MLTAPNAHCYPLSFGGVSHSFYGRWYILHMSLFLYEHFNISIDGIYSTVQMLICSLVHSGTAQRSPREPRQGQIRGGKCLDKGLTLKRRLEKKRTNNVYE
jgi:hypothetical protein